MIKRAALFSSLILLAGCTFMGLHADRRRCKVTEEVQTQTVRHCEVVDTEVNSE